MGEDAKAVSKEQKIKKKHVIITCEILAIFALGFYIGNASAINRMQKEFVQVALGGKENQDSESLVFNKLSDEENPIVTVDKIPYEITILEPDATGKVHLEATFTNNSSYAIKSFEMAVALKDKNEKVYLSSTDTVMPGQISLKFSSYGPQTQNKDDMEILSYQFIVVKDDGKEVLIKYDCKLNRYKTSGNM